MDPCTYGTWYMTEIELCISGEETGCLLSGAGATDWKKLQFYIIPFINSYKENMGEYLHCFRVRRIS